MLYKFKIHTDRINYLYPDLVEDNYFSTSDYQPIINYFGRVLIQIDDDDYQGDTRVLLKSNSKYGILIFGWGSCSGCDALLGCVSESELNELINDLDNSIEWFDTIEEVSEYISSDDRDLSYYTHSNKWGEFKNAILHNTF